MNLSPAYQKRLQEILQDPIIWAETFLKLPGGDDYFKANYVQKKVLGCKTNKCVILVSRRSGKTFSLIIKALYNIFTRSRCQVLLIAPGEQQLLKFFQDLDDILNANPHLAKDVIRSQSKPPRRTFANDSFIAGFIAKNGSASLRGQSGDLILIDEADFIDEIEWKVIDPIVRGDQYRKPPEMYAASTPNTNPKSRFIKLLNQDLTEDDIATGYASEVTPIFVPITENPDFSPETVAEYRREYEPDRLAIWEQEYLCMAVSTNDRQVFKKYQIEKAATLEDQISPRAPEGHRYTKEGYPSDIRYTVSKMPGEIRAVGVDWDRVQAGPTIIVVAYIPGLPKLRVIYREEVDKNKEFVYEAAAKRIIELHKFMGFDHIFLESTRDTAPSQRVQILAKQDRDTPDLFEKIVLIDFNENHISLDLKTHEQIKRRIKNVVVKNLQNLFENEQISFPEQDRTLNQQLSGYSILGYTERGERYSNKDEHFCRCSWPSLLGHFQILQKSPL